MDQATCEHRKLTATAVGEKVLCFCPECKWSGEIEGLPKVEGGRFIQYYGGCKVIRTNNLQHS